MKRKSMLYLIITLLMGGLSVLSCTKEADNATNNDLSRTQLEEYVVSGTWSIELFQDSGNNETHHFNGYMFTFASDGELTAENGMVTYIGAWSVTDSNSNDNIQSDLDFNIFFNLTNEFEDLNDNWSIVSQSAVKIELIDISGGNGGVDYLTIIKN